VFWYSILRFSETFFIKRRNQEKIFINVNVFMESNVILVRFELSLNFYTNCRKNSQTSNVMKIRPVGPEIFPEDRQT